MSTGNKDKKQFRLLFHLEMFILDAGLVCLPSKSVYMLKTTPLRTFILWTAFARSSCVKNHAFVGESGNKKLTQVDSVSACLIRFGYYLYAQVSSGRSKRKNTSYDHKPKYVVRSDQGGMRKGGVRTIARV